MKTYIAILLSIAALHFSAVSQIMKNEGDKFRPLSYEAASIKADSMSALMTIEEKIAFVGGDRSFLLRAIPRLHLPEVYMSDATQGVHIRDNIRDSSLTQYQPKKSTAFPCPISLAASWNPELSYRYAQAVGEECRAANIGILLGPGMNIYRQSQCGRNFEYFGEDPFLTAKMIEQFVAGVQSTGTVATLKHFLGNNTDYFRRRSNSIIDERTLHEIYMPSFEAGVNAGARAVMTSYNLINGEWAGQSDFAINTLLRKELDYHWLVMTDWSSVYDGEKVSKSGQDLEMPRAVALKDVGVLIKEGKVKVEDIDRMVKSILRTYYSMKLDERKKDPAFERFPEHEAAALDVAREGIVLLKNEGSVLPLKKGTQNILLTGDYVDTLAVGGGSANVKGHNIKSMLDELKKEFGGNLNFVKQPTIAQIASADVVLCNVGTFDSEGWDRSFELPTDQEQKAMICVNNNPNTIVIVTSGSGIKMTNWNAKAKAIIYAWYGGQIGNQALAEILAGKTNPSGKLPISIERDFKDSPGYGYIPAAESLYSGWLDKKEKDHPVWDLPYQEGVFVGYRWYEKKNIKPLYPFGFGLSYANFEYTSLHASSSEFKEDETITVTVVIKNTGPVTGSEIVQLYVGDNEGSVIRPVKELKGFKKIKIASGESGEVVLRLKKRDFSFWDTLSHGWLAEEGKFRICVGSSSADIRLTKEIELK